MLLECTYDSANQNDITLVGNVKDFMKYLIFIGRREYT